MADATRENGLLAGVFGDRCADPAGAPPDECVAVDISFLGYPSCAFQPLSLSLSLPPCFYPPRGNRRVVHVAQDTSRSSVMSQGWAGV